MLTLPVSDIKEYVKARLDEISNNDDAGLVSGDGAIEDLDKIIEAVIVPSVRKIHLEAPNILLTGGVAFPSSSTNQASQEENDRSSTEEGDDASTTIPDTQYHMLEIAVPSDFLRLVTLQMSDWSRPIQTLVGEDSAEYRKQSNKYLMGTPQKPVGALVHRNGTGVIELFSCLSSTATVLYAQYIPEPSISGTTPSVSVVSTLKYPCLNRITAEVLRSLSRHQEASVYDALAVEPFYIDPDYRRLNPPASERFNMTNNGQR